MKSFIILLLFLIAVENLSFGQYSVNKLTYNSKDYFHQAGDPYNPVLAGITSFFIPGVGQMISGEVGRGMAFLGGYMVGFGITAILISNTMKAIDNSEDLGEGIVLFTGAQVIGGFLSLGLFIYDIVACIDAVRVAKINNLAWRDKHNTGNQLIIKPFIHVNSNSNIRSTGFTFQVTF